MYIKKMVIRKCIRVYRYSVLYSGKVEQYRVLVQIFPFGFEVLREQNTLTSEYLIVVNELHN